MSPIKDKKAEQHDAILAEYEKYLACGGDVSKWDGDKKVWDMYESAVNYENLIKKSSTGENTFDTIKKMY